MQRHDNRFESPRSIAKFLSDIWAEQPVGWVQIVAVSIDDERKEHWLKSDNALHLRRIVDKHWYCDLYFTPHTFSERERKRRYALPSRLVHADVFAEATKDFGLSDAWTHPKFRWKVGEDYQALWIAPPGATLDQIEALCHGMGTGTDARVTRLLKCPQGDTSAHYLIRKYRVPINKYMGHVPKGKRSDVLWKIAVECLQAGLKFDEVKVVIAGSGAFASKREELGDRWAEREVERLPDKALNYIYAQIAKAHKEGPSI